MTSSALIALRSTIFVCLLAAPAIPALASTPLTGATSVSTGDRHACAIVNGGVKCWGANWAGQLGDGTETDRAIAADVSGLPAGSGVTAIAAGYEHSCAVVSGGVLCWGRNAEGQLGIGSPSVHATGPVPVATLGPGGGVTSIAAGRWFTCAVANGGVLCWGTNEQGVGVPSASPQIVIPHNSGVTAVSAGYAHACAVINGGVQCWGHGAWGQLGDGSYADTLMPVTAIAPASGVTTVSAGAWHTCATTSGGLQCWGSNASGELGIGTEGIGTESALPVMVSANVQQATGVSGGEGHTCAIVSGGVQCWGFNLFGSLGNGTWDHSNIPSLVVGLGPGEGATRVHAGVYFTCAVVNGGIQCWGHGMFGELGHGSFAMSSVPVSVLVDSTSDIPQAVGFVTGGGWFHSPAGAYLHDSSATGRAHFAFVARYKKDAGVPQGNTEFQLTAAGFSFRATTYEWLVISGAKATYKGVGRINGAGDFAFMISAIDGDLRPDRIDRIRVRIWDRATGATIYDNQTCGSTFDDEDACTALGGGEVVIHMERPK